MKPLRLNLRIAVTLIAVSFMAIQCSSENKSANQSTPGLTDTQAVAADQAALDITDFAFTGTDNATNLTQDFVVPVTGANGTTISWISDNPAVTIAADGTVTVTQPTAGGNITVTLTATVSRNGTDAIPVTFQVVVISADTVPPLLSSVTISSNNLIPAMAKAGDTISLNITASEPITTPLVTIAGVTATVTGSVSIYTASMVVQATDLQGSSAINISAFSDAAGNAGNTVTATTDGSFVTIDTAAPTNQNSVLTTSSTVTGGSQITITAAGAGNSVWLAPAGTTLFIAGSNMTTAGGTATSIAAPSVAGTYLLYIIDASGNISVPSNAIVTVDNAAPLSPASLALFSPMFSPGNNTTPAIQIGGVTSGDTVQLFTDSTCTAQIASGVATGTTINLTTSPLTEGNYTFYAHAVDVAGNVSPCSTASVTYLLDLTPPLLSSVTISSNNPIPAMAKAGDTISLNITASEPITTPLVTIAGVTATVTGSVSIYTASMIVLSADPQGSAAINIAFSDAAGNAGNTVTATTDGSFVTIDTAAPSAPTGLGALAVSSSRIDLSWTDAIDNISAPANLVYQVCQSTVSGGCSDASFSVLATTAAGALSYPAGGLTTFTQYFFKVRAIDELGNIGLASTEFSGTTLGIAPTVSYTGSPFSFHVNWAIVPQRPTLTGNPPTTCSSSPPLPTGLSIDATTCAISGTPTGTQVATDHVITATNAFGSSQTTINIAVGVAPTVSYSGSPFAFTQNSAIITINATLGGDAPTSCSANPPLPTGLSINATNCAISGTPTGTQVATDNVITASNAFGSGQTTINITVGAAPTVSYSGSPFSFPVNSAITPITATLGGNAPTSCSSAPTLPAGLSIDNTTCAISGTPTEVQSASDYTVTATNAFGSGQTTINIAVNGYVSHVQFSLNPGDYAVAQSLNLYSGTPGATIYYTTDGTTPATTVGGSTSPYTSAISVNADMTVKAIAVKTGFANSPVGSATYTIAGTASYAVGGWVSGLAMGKTVVIQNNGGDDLTLTGNGPFVFPTPIAATTNITVTVFTQPSPQTCRVDMDDSGTASPTIAMPVANFLSVSVVCGPLSLPVADTGQTSCYETNDNWTTGQAAADCTTATGGFTLPLGQDGAFSDIPFARSFTGPTQHGTFTNDYTTTDNVTGLVWKTCTEGKSDATCATGAATTATWIAAGRQCRALNEANSGAGYAGRRDWRLPTKKELESIPNYQVFNPSIDTVSFPSTDLSDYWTASTSFAIQSRAWLVTFNAGMVRLGLFFGPFKTTSSPLIRCVSGGNGSAPSFIDNGNETVVDQKNNLMWQQCPAGLSGTSCATGSAGTYTWADALTYCNALTLAGKSAGSWRLPSVNELKSIVDETKSYPAVDSGLFPSTFVNYYWSASTYVGGAEVVWLVSFGDGSVLTYPKTYNYSVRCVSGP